MGNWTWISGNQTITIDGYYGNKGTPSPMNHPGSRDGSASCLDKTNRTFWLFGGYIHYNSTHSGTNFYKTIS